MQPIYISDETYQAIASQHADIDAFVEQMARQALTQSAGKKEDDSSKLRFDIDVAIQRSEEFKGMLGKDATLDELLEDRRFGAR